MELDTHGSKHDCVHPLKHKDSFIGLSNSPFFSFFFMTYFRFPLFSMSNETILFQILYMPLEYLFFSIMKVRIVKFIQCRPCFINGPKFSKISLFKFFYIAIGHLVFVTLIHFMYIST